MHTIKLDVQSLTNSGSTHAKVIIDGHDAGILYLSQEEFDILSTTLSVGAANSPDRVTFSNTLPEEDEIEYDIFDD